MACCSPPAPRRPHRPRTALGGLVVLGALAVGCALPLPRTAASPSGAAFEHRAALRFDSSASSVELRLIAGTAGGELAYFVALETSDSVAARVAGATYVPRLAELRGTGLVQRGQWTAGRLAVSAGVDFAPTRRVTPGSEGFPPAVAEAGAVGRAGYSPYVEFADGSVWNIPVVADSGAAHDRVVGIDRVAGRARFRATRGYADGRTLWYVSTEASDPMVAAIEGATFVPALTGAQPGRGTADLVAFVNGPGAADDPAERHGMRSAMTGEGDPLNILAAPPGAAGYAPLWDLRMAEWTPRAVRDGLRERLLSLAEVTSRRTQGLVQGMGGAPEPMRAGALVNCPVVFVR